MLLELVTLQNVTNTTKNLLQKVFAVAVKTPFPGHQPLRNFSCIGIIAAHGSFHEAAKRLHVTQSTVSARFD
jgi:hypothetical protein